MANDELKHKQPKPWWSALKKRHLARGGADDNKTIGSLYTLGLELLHQHWDAEALDALLVEFDRRLDDEARGMREN